MRKLLLLKRTHHNCQSTLLTKNESLQLDRLIGPNYKSVATTVAQLYLPEEPGYVDWVKKECGVLCLVQNRKDHQRHFLRMFCLVRRKLIWEQQLDDDRIIYGASTSYFHTLNVKNGATQIGFNFADEKEASTFLRATRAYLFRRKAMALRSCNYKKAIGRPTHFRLVSHIGWDRQKGFTLVTVDQQLMNAFLARISNYSSNGSTESVSERCHLASFKRKMTKSDISSPIIDNITTQKTSQEIPR